MARAFELTRNGIKVYGATQMGATGIQRVLVPIVSYEVDSVLENQTTGVLGIEKRDHLFPFL